MVLFCEEAQVEGRFDLFGDSANLDARWVHGLHGTYNMQINPFGRTPIELLDDMCVGYFKRKPKNPHGYRCSLHPGVF